MMIRITDIPDTGLNINDTIPLSALNARIQEGSTCDIRFTSDPGVELNIRRTPNGADLHGVIKANLQQRCARCSEDKPRQIEVRADLVLQQLNPRDLELNRETFQEDIGIVYFEGEHIDLESTLQELIILQLSPFWHPDTSSSGKCSLCGLAERHAEVEGESGKPSLGELLKKAGLN